MERLTRHEWFTVYVLTNMYGHPHDETLERLEEAGAGVIRTDESGAIEIRAIEDKLQTFVYGDG